MLIIVIDEIYQTYCISIGKLHEQVQVCSLRVWKRCMMTS